MFKNYKYEDGRTSKMLVLMLASASVSKTVLSAGAVARHHLAVRPGEYKPTGDRTADGKWQVMSCVKWR